MSEKLLNSEQKSQARAWLRRASQPAKRWIMLTVAIAFTSALLLMWQLFAIAHIAYAAFILHQNRSQLTPYFILIACLIVVRALLSLVKSRVSFQTSAKVRLALRQKILNHLQKLGPIYAAKHSNAHWVSAMMEQAEGLHDYLVDYLPQMTLAVLIPIAILIVVFSISLVSGFILLVCAPLIPLFMALAGMGAASMQQKYFQTMARMGANFLDTIQGLVTLKVLGKSKQQKDKVHKISECYRMDTMKVLRVAFLSSAIIELFSAASIALLAIYLGIGYVNTGMHHYLWWNLTGVTLQSTLFILLLAPEFFLPLRQLGTHYHAKAKAIAAAVEIDKILSMPIPQDNINEKELSLELTQAPTITFNDVTVSYHGGKTKALKHLNFSIAAGEKVAIVGPSGAGKSTLLNSLLKFIVCEQGDILINDINLAQCDKTTWYQQLSWLGQDNRLFAGSIASNLTAADTNATQAAMWQALTDAQISDEIQSLPKKLDTWIGERHSGLSGGQAKRIALARMLLKPAKLLLLDEPTSSLDSNNETEICTMLTHFWQDKTVLCLTHHYALLEHVDRILVMDQGRIIQQGALSTLLLDSSGLFYQLFNKHFTPSDLAHHPSDKECVV